MLQWKKENDGQTALLIKGARRIGKSTIAEEFARNEYDSYIIIDFSIADNAWAYYPEQGIDNRAGATYPRLTTQNNENNYQTSSLWVVDAGYIKLRNVELGYQFRKGPRLYVSGQNLLTFSPLLSKYNLDPESPDGYYPALKSITAGITITF